MLGAVTTRHVGLLAAVAGILFLSVRIVEWRSPPSGRRMVASLGDRGIPDCPPRAVEDVVAPVALQCWFYDGTSAWRILSLVSAHHALVVDVEATSRDDVRRVADTIVRSVGSRFGEVMVYGVEIGGASRKTAPRRGSVAVTRIRWTPREGFSSLEYTKPAPD